VEAIVTTLATWEATDSIGIVWAKRRSYIPMNA